MGRIAWIMVASLSTLACGSDPIDLGSTGDTGESSGDPTPIDPLDPAGPYAPCSSDSCPAPAACNVDAWPDPNFGMCAPTCQSAMDCPPVEGATVDCALGGGSGGFCVITCSSDAECPMGTQCENEATLCLWPA